MYSWVVDLGQHTLLTTDFVFFTSKFIAIPRPPVVLLSLRMNKLTSDLDSTRSDQRASLSTKRMALTLTGAMSANLRLNRAKCCITATTGKETPFTGLD